ncbi:MAG: hypothetical protein ACOYKA_07360 [Legionellaceae bacterium]
MPLDLSWKLLYNACYLLNGLYKADPKFSGVSLIDGHRVEEGIDLKLENLVKISKCYAKDPTDRPIKIRVDDSGFFTIIMGKYSITLPLMVIDEFKMKALKKIVAKQSTIETVESEAVSSEAAAETEAPTYQYK